MTEITKELLRELFIEQKFPIYQIGKELNVSPTTVTNHLKVFDLIKIDKCPDVDKLRSLAADDTISNKEISKYFNVSWNTIWIWLKQNNISRSLIRNNEGKRPSKEDLEKIYQNKSQIEVAKIYGVSSVTVANWLKFYKLKRKSFKEIRNSDEYKEKYSKTCIERYGFDTPLKNPYQQQKMMEVYTSNNGYRSNAEIDCLKQIGNFLNCEFVSDRRILVGKEIDGYCNELKIAIEFCGLYWHSEKGGKSKNYHYDKFLKCQEKGIKLFTIFDHEWNKHSEKIKKYIYMNAGLAKKRIFARTTECRQIDNSLGRNFCEIHHLQGSSRSITNSFGLFHNNELISVMTFGKHHRNNNILVMNRFCGVFDIQIIGGASKLMKNASRILKTDIITWSDNRWSTGNVYEKMGCVLQENLSPDYQWTDFYNLYSKQSRQKKLTGQPIELTEKEYNESLGMSRIWDCGKKRWLYKTEKEPFGS